MQNSYQFFENKTCQYYPCHKDIEHLNCLFCYCPLYPREHCPGNFQYLDINGKKIKECTNCTFPHQAENYERIIKLLSHYECISYIYDRKHCPGKQVKILYEPVAVR